MKRKLLIVCIVAILFSAIVYPVYAHSGRTDSNGGHTDRSTGEYHYHHGYSAHNHYDMDGDGIDDCPYSFVDTTRVDSGYSSEKNSQKAQTNSVKKEKTKKAIISEIIAEITFVFPLCYCLSLLIAVPVCKILAAIFRANGNFAKFFAVVSIIVFFAGIVIYYCCIK